MAEGFLRAFAADRFVAYSAGTDPAVRVHRGIGRGNTRKVPHRAGPNGNTHQAMVKGNRMSIEKAVRDKYALVATSGLTSNHDGVRAIAEAFGYSPDELAEIPAEANMGLSCGNPTAFATLREGETVVDLGCGGGLDIFLAAKKVGSTGKAIGIDMTPEMVDLARRNAAKSGMQNVEFHQATIDDLPLADSSVDCVISNCVINLAADKPAVFREIARILKPGGRLAVSDIALKADLPVELGSDLNAYVGCIAGAIAIEDYQRNLAAAGFSRVQVIESGADLNTYASVDGQSGCCSPPMNESECCEQPSDGSNCCDEPRDESLAVVSCCSTDIHAGIADLLAKYNINDYAASVKVFAVKGDK
jgi:SAM-dependent methyltransferase